VDNGFSWESPSARLVLEAVLNILAEAGYESLTVEEIRFRAGPVGRALGDFPDVDVLVSAALGHIEVLAPPAPTGCLRYDLRALLRPWRGPRTRDEVIIAAVLSAADHRPLLHEAVHRVLDRPVAEAVGAILSRHLSERTVAERLQTLSWVLHGLILKRLRTGPRSAVDLERLIDFLIAGLDAAPRAALVNADLRASPDGSAPAAAAAQLPGSGSAAGSGGGLTRPSPTRTSDTAQSAPTTPLAALLAVLNGASEGFVALDGDGVIAGWNTAAQALLGWSAQEALGRDFADAMVAPTHHRAHAQQMSRLAAGLPVEPVELALRHRDGGQVWADARAGRPPAGGWAAHVFLTDIADRKTRTAEGEQESKLESLGRLSAGLAHEINSPIQFVGDNARFLEEAYQELIRVVEVYRGLLDSCAPISWTERQERVREAEASIDFDYLETEIPSAVAQTLDGIERVATIVRAMKTFSHPGHQEQVRADLNEALEATLTVARHQVKEVADIELDLGTLPSVRCNVADLNQVFLNLIVNAADAIEETGRRGTIGVTTRLDGDEVVIAISDTGRGIPDDIRSKIFDPFFTTKEVGRGSGQGLPLARGVIHEGHGGTLTLDTTPGAGSAFTIRLPIDGKP